MRATGNDLSFHFQLYLQCLNSSKEWPFCWAIVFAVCPACLFIQFVWGGGGQQAKIGARPQNKDT